jgi:hypothetical protein
MRNVLRSAFVWVCAWSLGASASAQVPYASSYPNEAWKVLRNWADVTPEAGMAWGANSGLNWHQKYAAWIQSMKKIPRHGGEGGFTFEMVTPWGKTLPAPVADCADTGLLLRSTFAAWYNLPFMFKAGSLWYGHFGIRVGPGNHKALCTQCDYSGMTADQLRTRGWPKSNRLRTTVAVGSGDEQPQIGGGRTGAYLDEIHLNKRAAYLIASLMNNAGSGSLAGSQNVYNIKPHAIRAGDVLIERWQMQGIGHTIVIKSVEQAAGGKLKVEIAAGWLPPRQTKWEGSVDAHGALSEDYFGGEGCAEQNTDGTCKYTYAHFGGGLKRWYAPVVATTRAGKQWVLAPLASDQAAGNVIDPTNYAELGKRTDIFEDLIYLPPPEELRDEYLRLIQTKRDSLRGKPSGCSAREAREGFFKELYRLMSYEFSMTKEAVDKKYRKTEDYVFSPLDYTKSSTCCWNGSTPAMGASVVANAIAWAKQKNAQGACAAPAVFMKSNGTYGDYQSRAGSVQWVPYRNDENCPQGASQTDVAVPLDATPFCTAKPFLNE